jgi:hypothetical protein
MAWDDQLAYLEMFHAQDSSLRLIMPASVTAGDIHVKIYYVSMPQYTCYKVGVFVSVLEPV